MFALRIRLIVVSALCAWLIFAVMGGAALSAQSPALSPHQPSAVVPACDPITTNTTWTTGNVYVVENCNLIVQVRRDADVAARRGGQVRRRQPRLRFLGGQRRMIVHGSLVAVGNAAQPVAFTS